MKKIIRCIANSPATIGTGCMVMAVVSVAYLRIGQTPDTGPITFFEVLVLSGITLGFWVASVAAGMELERNRRESSSS